MKGDVSSHFGSERGGGLCNNYPPEFCEPADVHRPNDVFRILAPPGRMCSEVVGAPRPIIEIDLYK